MFPGTVPESWIVLSSHADSLYASLEVKVDLHSSSLPLRPAIVQFNRGEYVLFVCLFVLNTTDR